MPRVVYSATTRPALPQDADRASKKNQNKHTRFQPIDEVDKQQARQFIQREQEEKQQDIEKRKKDRKKEIQEARTAKPILNETRRSSQYKQVVKSNQTENQKKYVRPKFAVSKMAQGYYQVQMKKRNKQENIRKSALADSDAALAELKLAETEVLRNISVPSGIELDKDDIFTDTTQISQEYLVDNVDIQSQKKVYDLLLDKTGPYLVQYTPSGRNVLLAGHTGHIASLKWSNFELVHENTTGDSVYAVQWMMDDSMYAVAQQKRSYVFDERGVEIHSMHDFHRVRHLSYLPFHFLLVGATPDTNIIYKDISVGRNVTNIQLDPTHCMTPNHYNAVMCLGHSNGTVSMVTPRDSNKKPVVSMFCHKAPVKHIAVDHSGVFMTTISMDNTAKVWDIRKTYQPVVNIDIPNQVSALSISQTGMTSIAYEDTIVIWKHPTQLNKKAYLRHKLPIGVVRSMDFCPYEDVLGIGHSHGFSSILVPGSGQANYDSRLPNPYSTDKQIKDYNVKSLLEKIPADMITLNPSIVGTSGLSEKTQTYSKNVEITEDLKKQLDGMGVVEKDKLVKKRKFENLDVAARDALREELMKQNEELKASVSENWWEDKKPDALNRFASLKKRKIMNDQAEKAAQKGANDNSEENDSDLDDLEAKEIEALKALEDSDDESSRTDNAFSARKRQKMNEKEESSDEEEEEENDANLLDGLVNGSDDDDEEEEDEESEDEKFTATATTMTDNDDAFTSGTNDNDDNDDEIVDPFADDDE